MSQLYIIKYAKIETFLVLFLNNLKFFVITLIRWNNNK